MNRRFNTRDLLGKELLAIIAIALLSLAGLSYWHVHERAAIEKNFIDSQIATVMNDKRTFIESTLGSVYENVRTITLLPSVRSIKGGNRINEDEDVVKTGRFSVEGWATVQQIYNNLATRVSVSEIYAVMDGLEAGKGQVPFFMFDALVFGDKAVEEEEEAKSADTPDESEDAEYDYFPGQIAAIKAAHPRFDFARMEDIPAFTSPMMRTCDNTQYLSKASGDEKDSHGMLYSVPFYTQRGEFRGVISAIIRANVLEALLLGVPFVPVTEKDLAAQKHAGWQMPDMGRFMLSNEKHGIRIFDRRHAGLPQQFAAGRDGRNTFQVKLNLPSDGEWLLSYYLPEEMIANETREHDRFFWILLGIVIGALVAAGVATMLLARIRMRLGGKTEAVAEVVQAVSEGKLDISIPPGVAPDSVLGSMEKMLEKLRAADKAAENARIREALDSVSTHVMIADVAQRIIYTNRSARDMLDRYRIKDALADQLERHTDASGKQIIADGRTLAVSINMVRNENGERIGSVLEWNDRTAEEATARAEQDVLAQIAALVEAAVQGDFSTRIDLAGKSGFLKELGDGMNRLMDTSETGLTDVGRVLGALSEGDLTQTITADYAGTFGRLKEDTNTTIDRLREMVGQIQLAASAINTAAKEIAAGNGDLSARTEEQSANIEETASSMEELNATVRQNATNAQQAKSLATGSNETVSRGSRVMKEVVNTMSAIQDSSKKIADIVGVINSISFQTNILALNAAVEAARAGEQGRGFAVVATEVRNLSQRSATAAREIKELITASVDQVEQGAHLVDQAGQTMEAVVVSFGEVAGLVADISSASQEQSHGIAQVTKAVSQMDNVTQQNAALVEEAAAAAESLEEQAQSLVGLVSQFRLPSATSLSGTVLCDATPRRLTAQTQAARRKAEPKKLPPAYRIDDEEESWAEF